MFYFKATLEPFCITPDRQKKQDEEEEEVSTVETK